MNHPFTVIPIYASYFHCDTYICILLSLWYLHMHPAFTVIPAYASCFHWYLHMHPAFTVIPTYASCFHCDTYICILLPRHSLGDCRVHQNAGTTSTPDMAKPWKLKLDYRLEECKDENTLAELFNDLSSCNLVPLKSKQQKTAQTLYNLMQTLCWHCSLTDT
jgi:hypothetical protein